MKRQTKWQKGMTRVKVFSREARLEAANRKFAEMYKQEQDRSKRLEDEVKRLNERVTDNDRRHTRQLEAENVKDARIKALIDERERIVRMVDQFTSISISQFTGQVAVGANTPADLRVLRKS